MISGEAFDIEDSSDEDTLVFRLFGVSSRISAIKVLRAIEFKTDLRKHDSLRHYSPVYQKELTELPVTCSVTLLLMILSNSLDGQYRFSFRMNVSDVMSSLNQCLPGVINLKNSIN